MNYSFYLKLALLAAGLWGTPAGGGSGFDETRSRRDKINSRSWNRFTRYVKRDCGEFADSIQFKLHVIGGLVVLTVDPIVGWDGYFLEQRLVGGLNKTTVNGMAHIFN